jgi:hypothetical protein
MNKRKISIKELAEREHLSPAQIVYDKYSQYVRDRRIEAVENYDRACSEDFEGWTLHHKKEDKHTAKELIALREYYYVDPNELIWLTIEEHEAIHREINKLPWRIELETKRVEHMKRSMKAWSEERKEKRAKATREWWDDEQRKRIKETRDAKREKGENLVNVAQLDSKEAYREYQKQYQRLHYRKNRQAWLDYNAIRRLNKKSTEELVDILNQKRTRSCMPEDKKKRLIDLIMKVLNEREDFITCDKYQKIIDNESIESIKQQIEELNRKMENMQRGL